MCARGDDWSGRGEGGRGGGGGEGEGVKEREWEEDGIEGCVGREKE